jgi:Fe-S cluster assembly scaffold protein SufB
MTKQKSQISTFPFQISELPKGVTAYPDGRIVADEKSSGTVVLRIDGKIKTKEINLNIKAGKNSYLKIVLFQNISADGELDLHINCVSEESAKIDFIQFHLGGAKVNMVLTQETAGVNSELNADLLSRTKDKQEYNFDLTNVYNAKFGHGKILAKGVALDESRMNMTGTIRITKNGGGTDTFLKQDSLFLSKNAKISSSPRLEIGTNDVKAGHGASVSNLNEETLFYLNSRGISANEAKKMLVSGFVSEQLDKINELPELREYILSNI